MKKIICSLSFLILAMGTFQNVLATADARLLRFPDINQNLIAFVYAGDIWTVSSSGGEARRLTSHQGMELFPKISPDGQWIAFSGEYSGSRQIFVIPSNGGFGVLSPDGSRMVFTPVDLEFRNWKRYNGGGFIPDRMADLLDRHTLVYWHQNGLQPGKSPAIEHDGPKAMLINGYSSSGGDAFPYYFRKLGLGKLIGTRPWGGLVGISGNARLVDGGYLSVPRFGIFDQEDGWIIEGVGVSPDIEVVDRPEQLARGIDPSVEKAVEVLLQELKQKPGKKVTVPPSPDRSKWREEK